MLTKEKFKKMIMQSKGFHDLLKKYFANTSITWWSYVYIDSRGQYFQIDSDPMIFKQFIDEDLFLTMLASKPLTTQEFFSCKLHEKNELDDTLTQFSLQHGYHYFFNITNREKNKLEIITFASKEDNSSALNYILNNKEKVSQIVSKIKSCVKPLLRAENFALLDFDTSPLNNLDIEHSRDLISHLKSGLQEKSENIDFANMENESDGFNLNSLPFYFPIEKSISNREKDVIYLLYNGFNTKQSAEILNISRRTIERSFTALTEKFGCNNKHQVINTLLNNHAKK